MTALNDTIGRARRRRQVDRALMQGGRGLLASSCAGLVLLAVDRLVPLHLPGFAYATLIVAGIGAGAVVGLARRPRRLEVAVGLDRTLHLADRLGSAAALEAPGADTLHDPGFRALVERDAQDLAGRIDVGRATPVHVRSAWAGGCTLAAALWLGTLYLPSRRSEAGTAVPAPDRASRIEDESEARETLLAAIDEAVQTLEVRETQRTDDAVVTEQLQALSSLAQQLKDAPGEVGDLAAARDESAARLNELADTLAAEADREIAAAAEVARRFSKHEPAELPASGRPLLDALQQGEYDEAADRLDELLGGDGTLSDAEREALGESLREMSRQLGDDRPIDGTDPGERRLGEALSEHGLDPALIDSLLDQPSPADRDELERTLRDEGVDAEVARRLAEDLAQHAGERAVEELADRRAETIAGALERSADQLDPEPSSPDEPGEPGEPTREPANLPATDAPSPDERRQPEDERAADDVNTGPPPLENEPTSEPGESRDPGDPVRDLGSSESQDSTDAQGEDPSRATRDANPPDSGSSPSTGGESREGERIEPGERESVPDPAGDATGRREGERGDDSGQPGDVTEDSDDGSASESATDETGRPDETGEPVDAGERTSTGRSESGRTPDDRPVSTDEPSESPGETPDMDATDESMAERSVDEDSSPAEVPLDQLEKLPLDKLPLDQLEKLPLDKLPLDQLEKLPLDKLPLDQLEKLPLDKLPLDQLEKLPLDKLPRELLEKLPMEELARRLSETPPESLRDLARRLDEADNQREVSEDARRIARELMDRTGGRQPERWGDRPPERPGDSGPGAGRDNDTSVDRAGPGAGADGGTGQPDDAERPPAPIGRVTETVDLRGEELGDQVIAQLLTDQEATATATVDRPAAERVRTAQRVAKRAVNESAVPSRYHRLINRYFGRLDETFDAAKSKGAAEPEPAAPDPGPDDAGDP